MAGRRKATGRPWWIPAAVQPRQGVLVQTSHKVQLTSGNAPSPKSRRRHVLQHAVAATANLCAAAHYGPCLPMLGRVERRVFLSCVCGPRWRASARNSVQEKVKRAAQKEMQERSMLWRMSGARLCPSRGDSVYSCSDELLPDVHNAHGFPVKL